MSTHQRVSVDFLVANYTLTEECCSRQISEVHIDDISRCICRKWRSLVPQLKLKGIVISDIEHETGVEEERRSKFLNLWKKQKGSEATYRWLIHGLLEIDCRSDAEYVCKLLKTSESASRNTASTMHSSGSETASKNPKAADYFSSDVMEDLQYQLKTYRDEIQTEFAFFVSSLHDKLVCHNDVSVSNLRFFLLHLPALNCDDDEETCTLLYGVKSEFQKADSIDSILLLLNKYTSFLDYDIYLSIMARYRIDVEREKSEYLKHLNEYVNKHTISDLITVIPTMCKHKHQFSDISKTLVLKLNIKISCKFAELLSLKSAVAKLLGFRPSALQLVSISKGCVLATFSVPILAAEYLFRNKKFTSQEKEQLGALSVMWLKYDDYIFNFTECDHKAPEFDGKDQDSYIQQNKKPEQDTKVGVEVSFKASKRKKLFKLFRHSKKRHNKNLHSNVLPKPVRVYEKLPESVFICGSDAMYHCHSDSFSLSGVSGNIPGVHRMPTYAHDNSSVSEDFPHYLHSASSNYYDASMRSIHHSRSDPQPLSDDVLLFVMNCLMHKKDCEIFNCPCQEIQKRYESLQRHLEPLDSSTDDKSMKAKMALDHRISRDAPHSRSLPDLAPTTEICGVDANSSNFIGTFTQHRLPDQPTRASPHLKSQPSLPTEISLSADHLPKFYHNDCLLQVSLTSTARAALKKHISKTSGTGSDGASQDELEKVQLTERNVAALSSDSGMGSFRTTIESKNSNMSSDSGADFMRYPHSKLCCRKSLKEHKKLQLMRRNVAVLSSDSGIGYFGNDASNISSDSGVECMSHLPSKLNIRKSLHLHKLPVEHMHYHVTKRFSFRTQQTYNYLNLYETKTVVLADGSVSKITLC